MNIWTVVLILSFVQNIAFSMVSRARNRNNWTYQMIASCASNLLYFFTLFSLFKYQLDGWLAVPYVLGNVSGSLLGVKISMMIEKRLGATTDDHVRETMKKEKSNWDYIPKLDADKEYDSFGA